MMGWDDISVGLGDVFAMNQSDNVFPPVGDCKMCILLEDISAEVLMIKEMCFSIPSNKYAEFNVPPFVFRKVSFRIRINITLIPLSETFMGEIIGAIFMGGDHHNLKPTIGEMPIKVIAEGVESMDGQILINDKQGKSAKILKNVDTTAYYNLFADQLGSQNRSAVLGSYDE
ncbi:hypothetical protein PVK06_035542 [Gossypium arboreum]|uniref:Uncharacterized protein n=1 Tax=Gossypium arboreum TaxID=29729 RepID=A0ABR0NHI9_GOSAR|nr:hypothetical protein PVK06_035542 [Gossypium arboreum]